MRKTQAPGLRPADRIVLRAERAGPQRPTAPAARPLRQPRDLPGIAATAKTRRQGVTMDYQMGFTSGPSH